MSLVEVKGLTKKFGKYKALDNVHMEINEGEIYGFIGPNGAGKSTTIRILLGMLKATSGEVKIFGNDAWEDAVEIHKYLAYVPGEANLWPNLTGGEVIDIFLKMRGNGSKNKRDELIERFNLDPTKKCRAYSKGNRQKIALISAFASDAQLYILDEPTSGLDPLMERTFQECVLEVKNEGKSVLLSSHILSEVEKLCDTISIIREGKVIETGTLNEMRHLTRTNLHVQTKQPLPSIQHMKGVHHVDNHSDGVSIQIDSEELGTIIKFISDFGILKLESTPPTLEDLFLRHYENSNSVASTGGRGI
ncbi:ABC transporter ATP-binding protein [Ureibacillus manganicus]|uniref:ABC transporter ATP-binding protein n=1 Tax=Ureibacillus manganicus DSM 26584 TaxID=1384049 RepID=A0A0A3IQ90_9BACL|nr:ABC transporter ATP-binding protein [Ureibacillus manganicus]KGR77007.1 ABC transporter ATP-binding protein [Ureibacillus manganicus DSM 26584]